MSDLLKVYSCMKSFAKDEEFLTYIKHNKFKKYNDFFLNIIDTLEFNREEVFNLLESNNNIRPLLKRVAVAYEAYYKTSSRTARKVMIVLLVKIINIGGGV